MTDTTTAALSARQFAWLRTELTDWTAHGLIDAATADRISQRYRTETTARFHIGRLLLGLGAAFVGVGLIWLVAAHLDELSPGTRFAAIAVTWLTFLLGGEVLAARRASAPVVGAARLLAALGVGAVIFQAAQSLQVPAFEPRLIGLWSAGALVHAYATRAYLPFVVGVCTGLGWWFTDPFSTGGDGLGAVVLLGTATLLAAGLAILHDDRLPAFAWTWRTVAGGLALVTLFVAAIPGIGYEGIEWSSGLTVATAVTALALVAAVITSVRSTRSANRNRRVLEPLGALAVVAIALGLALWTTGLDASDVRTEDWLHAAASVLAYVALAVALLVLGTVREHPALTWMATAGLVVFATFQSFAVFGPIVTGAWLFVVLGTVFLGTGFLIDRARRELAQALTNSSKGN